MQVRTIIITIAAGTVSLSAAAASSRPPVQTHGPTASHSRGGPKATTQGHSQPHGGPKTTAGKSGGSHKASAPATAPVGSTTPALNPIAQKVSSNKGLMPKVAALLPPEMTLDQASFGFKNQGQFIAALHVSRNLGIPFADLKTAMTGITPVLGEAPLQTPGTPSTTPVLSLGQAIQKLRPSANAGAEVTTAEHQSTRDLDDTKTATTTTASKRTETHK